MKLGKNNSLGEWAACHSSASRVFIKNNLDFCCEGNVKLEDACIENNLDIEELITEIQEHSKDVESLLWNDMPPEKLIDEILERFHKKHRKDIEYLIPLAKKVESVHSGNPGCPTGLSLYLEKLMYELEMHMQKEEKILFPIIKSGQSSMAQGPITIMTHEHVSHRESLLELRKLAHNFKTPDDACGSWISLYQGAQTLERELMEHIGIENNILFPKALTRVDGCCGSCS
ncbi:iron-sulfur cluster repair di-iron protein [Bacteriovorax sp. BAL6_X]|uniref:iron-sulfur cluster repair di-iron protein n=1 Tax=Bacteriovorax sp. BAL6_X TaxID=1201290 RepID=UPI000385F0C6|nr:iron-sulfur cluster repair di-iron protein [Bacteriovorax sp. BAL6_X]EPZ51740.1 iron-sulfur cluster repair di-iron protein [Bacteriovorax sp. BAL6_X]